jgi:hypothetical protein
LSIGLGDVHDQDLELIGVLFLEGRQIMVQDILAMSATGVHEQHAVHGNLLLSAGRLDADNDQYADSQQDCLSDDTFHGFVSGRGL